MPDLRQLSSGLPLDIQKEGGIKKEHIPGITGDHIIPYKSTASPTPIPDITPL